MGKCSECGKKIEYNKYKMYRGKVLCLECYSTRLKRKAEAKAERKRQAELVKIATPSRKTKKKAKKSYDIPKFYGGDDEPEDKAEDSN
ncbi:unnamed protein product [marine sediment metagenome]|uniref:Zinc finger DksA/TraR C4-type domain-containing protein n=1 Tax=marine sediment metagenome TaxID=412755 RepID=X0YY46_9ZZZZ